MGTVLSIVGMVAGLAGSTQQAAGQRLSGEATANSYAYQAQIAENNARIAKLNAGYTAQVGEIDSTNEGMKTAADVAAMKAKQGASGVDVNSGSALDARLAAERIGQINALTIKSNKAREAWGYRVDSSNEELQASLDKRSAGYAMEGAQIASGGTLLGGIGNFAGQLSNFGSVNGFGSGFGSSATSAPSIGPTWDVAYG